MEEGLKYSPGALASVVMVSAAPFGSILAGRLELAILGLGKNPSSEMTSKRGQRLYWFLVDSYRHLALASHTPAATPRVT